MVVDIATGTRRGKLATPRVAILAISPTGDQVMLVGTAPGSEGVHVWTPASGDRETSALPLNQVIDDAAWVDGAFRMLIRTGGQLASISRTFGDTVRYLSPAGVSDFSWTSTRQAAYVAVPGKCYESEGIGNGCTLTNYVLGYSTPKFTVQLGSLNASSAQPSLVLRASPDGKWLLHQSYPQAAFLIRNPQP